MSTINLYEQLECTSINGTWAYTGTTTPNPAAPSTYNGTIDFTGYATGIYEYTYTTPGSKTVKVTVDWIADGVDRIHNVYTGALTIPITTISNINEVYTDNNLDYCDNGFNKPTTTSTAIFDLPTYFPSNISGDLWYQILLPVCLEAYEVNVTISSDLVGVGLIIHTYYPDINITAAKLVKASNYNNTGTVVSASFGVDAKARVISFIRVFTTSLCNFSININSGHTCTPSVVDPNIVISGIADAYQENFTANGTTNAFTITKGDGTLPTSQDSIMVTRNGQFLQSTYFSHDALSGTVTLTFTPYTGEEITVIWFDTE